MGNAYAQRKLALRPTGQKAASQKETARPSALRAGLAQPSAAEKGSPIDLPDAMRAKMENAFGADLSAVKLYESQAVADAGAEAVSRGSEIAFAPGLTDFSGYSGQALLGHEISHVVSQQRGEVTGSGFLNDRALEVRADREGAMAAAGQQIAAPSAALSTSSAAPAAGPMQARKKRDEENDRLAATYGSAVSGQQSPLSQLNGPMAAPQFTSPAKAEKASSVWKYVDNPNNVAKSGKDVAGSLAGAGNFIASLGSGDALKGGIWGAGIKPASGGLLGGAGMLTGAATALSSGASAYRGFKNIKAGGSRADPLADAALALGGVSSAASGAFSTVSNVVKIPGLHITAAAKGMADLTQSGQALMPGLTTATGALTLGAGLYQGIRGGMRLHQVRQQIKTLEDQDRRSQQPRNPDPDADDEQEPPPPFTDDQRKMLRTMRQGERIQERNRTGGILKAISGGFATASGITSLSGVAAPIGLALGAIGAGVGAAGTIYNLAKTRKIRHDVLAEELGDMDYKSAVADVKAKTGKKMTDSRAWKIFLKSKGYTDEKALYADVRKRRAAHMLQMANGGDQNAINFIRAMGIKQVNGGYAEGALDLLAGKLG